MKLLSLLFNLILSIAVAVLFYLHFSVREDKPAEQAEIIATQPKDNSGKIVYVNTDTLWTNYQLVKDMQDELAGEKLKKEGYYSQVLKKLEEDYIKFQQQAPTMTMQEGQQKELEMQEKQQELFQLEEKLKTELMQSEQKKNKEIQLKINEFLDGFSKEKGYQLIFGYSLMSDLLYAPDSLDITPEVINRLNTIYQEEKEKTK